MIRYLFTTLKQLWMYTHHESKKFLINLGWWKVIFFWEEEFCSSEGITYYEQYNIQLWGIFW